MHLQLRSGTLTATTLFQKVHLQLRSRTLTATTLLQKVHLQLRHGPLTATTLFQKVHLQLSTGTLTAATLLQTVHLQLSAGPLTASTQFAKCAFAVKQRPLSEIKRKSSKNNTMEESNLVFSHATLLCWCFHAQQANVQPGSEFALVNLVVVDESENFQPSGIGVPRPALRASWGCAVTSLRCRRTCWRLDANVPCGRASACLFAVLVLRGPASEKAALHSWPSNSRFNSPALIDFGGGQGRNIPNASHEFPTWCLILETAKVCTRNQKDGSSSSSHAKRTAQHYRSCLLYTSPSPRDGLLSRMPSSA